MFFILIYFIKDLRSRVVRFFYVFNVDKDCLISIINFLENYLFLLYLLVDCLLSSDNFIKNILVLFLFFVLERMDVVMLLKLVLM